MAPGITGAAPTTNGARPIAAAMAARTTRLPAIRLALAFTTAPISAEVTGWLTSVITIVLVVIVGGAAFGRPRWLNGASGSKARNCGGKVTSELATITSEKP